MLSFNYVINHTSIAVSRCPLLLYVDWSKIRGPLTINSIPTELLIKIDYNNIDREMISYVTCVACASNTLTCYVLSHVMLLWATVHAFNNSPKKNLILIKCLYPTLDRMRNTQTITFIGNNGNPIAAVQREDAFFNKFYRNCTYVLFDVMKELQISKRQAKF